MNQNQWISLLQFSAKYGTSLSTLRRRIKTNTIAFKLDQGKYFLLDDSPSAIEVSGSPQSPSNVLPSSGLVEASVLSSAHKLVEEIKTAYSKILQEKENQISLLKDEVVALRMLAR